MKRISTLIIAIGVTAFGLSAKSLTPEEALQRFRSNSSAMKMAPRANSAQQPTLTYTATTTDGSPAAYVFSQPGNNGFIVLAGDDVALPLLGYSDQPVGEGVEMPPQMIEWLNGYAADIEAVNANATPVEPTMAYAASSQSSERTPIAPLLKTKWNQSSPYNNLCPMQNGSRSYTGCVATAMAQIMKYYQHGTTCQGGTHSYTTRSASIYVSLNFNNVKLDWGNMLNVYGYYYDDNGDPHWPSSNSTQNEAVANLMKACGVAVDMDYTSSASGAYSEDVPAAFETYFGYASGGTVYSRDLFNASDWNSMVYDNLKDVGPVYYSGSSSEGGHAFVCDGYSSDNYFHFNWGWGGHYDGYFQLNALNPDGTGIGGYEGGYNQNQRIIIGLHPTKAGLGPNIETKMYVSNAVVGEISGSTLSISSYNSGGFANGGPGSLYTVNIGAMFIPMNGGENQVARWTSYFSEIKQGYGWWGKPFDFNISSISLKKGESYRVYPVYKHDGNTNWSSFSHTQFTPNYFILNVSNSGSYSIQNLAYDVPEVEPMAVSFTSDSGEKTYVHFIGRDMNFKLGNFDPSLDFNSPISLFTSDTSKQNILEETSSIDLTLDHSTTSVVDFAKLFTSSISTGEKYVYIWFDEFNGYFEHQIFKYIFREDPGTVAPNWFKFQPRFTNEYENEMEFNIVADLYHVEGVLTDKYYDDIFELDLFEVPGASKSATRFNAPAQNLQHVATLKSDRQYLSKENAAVEFKMNGTMAVKPGTTYRAYLYSTEDENYAKGDRTSLPAEKQRYVEFSTEDSGVTTAIEDVKAEPGEILMSYNALSATLEVSAAKAIRNVAVCDAQGRVLAAPAAINGQQASVDLSALPNGLLIATVTDADGNSRSIKVVR